MGQGFAAAADGFIPYLDPFDSFYDPADESLQWSQFFGGVSRDALFLAAGVKIIAIVYNPATVYHFTSTAAAESITTSGTINTGAGLFGNGVYASSFNSAFIARLMGAKSTEAVFGIAAGSVTKYPTLIPGAWRIIHSLS